MSGRTMIDLGLWGPAICALVLAGIFAADPFGMTGAFFFYAATVAFLFPFYRRSQLGSKPEDDK